MAILLGMIPASAKVCTELQAVAAESVVDYVESWKKLHGAYKEFGHCDDGSVAEGFSSIVARLMTGHWEGIGAFRILAEKDSGFKFFVLRHIDGTWSLKDLTRVEELAKTQCAEGDGSLCRDLINAVREARTP